MGHLRRSTIALLTTAIVASAGCGSESLPVAPRLLDAGAATAAALDEQSFDIYNDFDLTVSCVAGNTHWQGWIHLVVTTVSTPSGVVSTNYAITFDPSYFVELPGGVRYYPVAGFPVHEHHTDGPLSIVAGTAAGVFKSADGNTLPLGYHVQVVYDPQGQTVVDWKFTGVCP